MAQELPREKQRVLVVEDDPDLQELLRYNLEASGYEVKSADAGETGLREAQIFSPDVVLLDLMLSDMSGLDVCRRIRAAGGRRQPVVIMLTAKGDEIDRVVGFEVGADDYVVKPFSMRELLLRVRSHLRDSVPADHTPALGTSTASARARRRFEVGQLKIDMDEHRVLVGEEEIAVSALEMRLLVYLAQKEGMVCPRSDLLTDVWHYSPEVTTRTVDTHIKRLRDKLGRAGGLIQTVRGLGYRLSDPTADRRGRAP